ncbi:subtilisin-like protease 4 [Lolium rigidum]|uniref:subtilisin-like protease 4 n=1 Tax=Lolium rigidum TaxID=89674 RepID=UPI001F5E2C94|nr:subtilisin-like protease 4 [Lolium rigidum]
MDSRCFLAVLFLLLSLQPQLGASYLRARKNYIVHLDPTARPADSLQDWHRSFLPLATAPLDSDDDAGPRIIYSYTDVFTGCSRCSIMDIIAGLDAAVKDGIDVLSFSIGASSGTQFNYDPIAIAAFKAMERGIVVSCAAGNAGPDPGSLVLCESRGLNGRIEAGQTVAAYGGLGIIVMNRAPEGYTTFADPHVLPASHVSYDAGTKIAAYVNSTATPTASIAFKGTVMGASPAPAVTFFSSRGPSRASPGILKPDITGPGMNILAAWAPSESHTEFSDGDVGLSFFVESGTSMSTPHLSGIAALLKGLHPDWSPAAIKSAIMTTSDAVDRTGVPLKDEQYRHATFYAMGAGYVNPELAVDPGLVYDLHADDYLPYLCGLGIGDDGVTEIAHRPVACASLKATTEADLNYPSLVVNLLAQPITVNRTVTNVGKPGSIYTAVVDMPGDVSVTVQPPMLRFTELNEKQSFTVTVRWAGQPNLAGAEGNLKWVSEDNIVRSPIVVPAKAA